MWRFAIYTKKSTILSKTCYRAVQQALKHTGGRSDFMRFSSHESVPAICPEKRHNVHEVFSIDDFGLLSLNGYHPAELMNPTNDEPTFIETIFRNDTLNAFSTVQIPTTVSSKELGGTNEIFGYDYVTELLSEEAIPEEIAENLGMSICSFNSENQSMSKNASYHDDQQPSTSGLEVTPLPFLIPNLKNKLEDRKDTTMDLLGKIPSNRNMSLSTTEPLEKADEPILHIFHANENVCVQNIGEMIFPESLPLESYTSQWKGEKLSTVVDHRAPPTTVQDGTDLEFSLDIMEEMVASNAVEELRNFLKTVEIWPEWLFNGNRASISRINNVLRFFVEHCDNGDEREKVILNICTSSIVAEIADDVILQHVIKTISPKCKIQSILERLERSASWANKRELRPHHSLVQTRLVQLYTLAIQDCPKASLKLFNLCTKLNFDRSSDIFMKCYGESQACSENFLTSFSEWKILSLKYGTQQGIDSYWLAALESQAAGIEKRIEALLLHSAKSEHPFTTIAKMISALLKLNKMDEALEVIQKVAISGKHFKEPLKCFVEKKDLKCIERLADLVQQGMIAEKRRGIHRSNKEKVESEKKQLLGKGVHAVLDKFYGIGGEKRRKFVGKKIKRKIHRVDEEQLHDLCKALQKAWIQCSDDKDSVKRLVSWCQWNRVEIEENVQKRIDTFLR